MTMLRQRVYAHTVPFGNTDRCDNMQYRGHNAAPVNLADLGILLYAHSAHSDPESTTVFPHDASREHGKFVNWGD